jgi:Xaa-Pro dipeptidase
VKIEDKLRDVQKKLEEEGLDGWLLYDFRCSNDLAFEFLEIPAEKFFTRRFFYWIPSRGKPIKIVHRIESENLDHLPGDKWRYLAWQELESHVEKVLSGAKRIAMEYSPRNAIPYVSKVDAGTMDMVRDCGVEVVSSADFLQIYTSVWDKHKLKTHLEAADVLDQVVAKSWELIAKKLKGGQELTEYDVQQFILSEFEKHNCITEGPPICATNEHAADPHYIPASNGSSLIKEGDFILIDLWCKKNVPYATYGDITRVGVAAKSPTARQQEIFSIVKDARDFGTQLVKERFERQEPLMGWEIDAACRKVIEDAGYGEYFIHRTGHNIDVNDHGNGAHIDNLETQDKRRILLGTCFSIEPGIYIPGELGVRLEYDVVVHHDGTVQVTGGIQESITCIMTSEAYTSGIS